MRQSSFSWALGSPGLQFCGVLVIDGLKTLEKCKVVARDWVKKHFMRVAHEEVIRGASEDSTIETSLELLCFLNWRPAVFFCKLTAPTLLRVSELRSALEAARMSERRVWMVINCMMLCCTRYGYQVFLNFVSRVFTFQMEVVSLSVQWSHFSTGKTLSGITLLLVKP